MFTAEECKTSTPCLSDVQQEQPAYAEEDRVYSRLLKDYGNVRQSAPLHNTSLKSILRQDSFRVRQVSEAGMMRDETAFIVIAARYS